MAIRYLFILLFMFFGSINSYSQKPIENKLELCSQLSEMIKNDQEIRFKIPDSFNPERGSLSKKQIDSLKLIRRKIDKYNTEKLIKLTKNHGWINASRIGCKDLKIWVIFRHSDPKYFPAISNIIEKELKAERLDKWEYTLIKNHIKGRPH